MTRARPDPTYRVAVIDPNYASREQVRSLLAWDHRICIAVSDASDILAMSARARRFTWAYLACDGPLALAERQIAGLRLAISPEVPLLVAVPLAHVEAVNGLLDPRDSVLAMPCASLQLAARLVDFARQHRPRPQASAALGRASGAALHLQASRWWR